MNALNRYRGTLLGLACGDAVGAALEFAPRGARLVQGMEGGGPFQLEPGYWTDDTSMALALAASLVTCGEFAPTHIMNYFVAWWKQGEFSSTGHCFDIGGTTQQALARYLRDGDPYAGVNLAWEAGNGSLMRLAPVVLWYYPDRAACRKFAAASSRLTHGADEAVAACVFFAELLAAALDGQPKDAVLLGNDLNALPVLPPSIRRIADGDYMELDETQIVSDGYVVNTLRAALWCFYHTNTFADAVLKAANLGHDADTTAAVCGQIAGAYYDFSAIPRDWLRTLHDAGRIDAYALALYGSRDAEVEEFSR